jgi:hypothetical protein
MEHLTLDALREIFSKHGATKILLKPLAENDNSKQQVYLGSDFDVLKEIPYGEVVADSTAKVQNFKAEVNFAWLTQNGDFEPAPHTKLILYPSYPEVRLSGFLRGCSAAPNEHMRPIPKEERGPKNQWDGRVLCMGITNDGRVLAYLATANSAISKDFVAYKEQDKVAPSAVSKLFFELGGISVKQDTQALLLAELTRIRSMGWTDSVRLKNGQVVPYAARNGGGYTLEALLGVEPNGRSEPDFMGWEVKGHSGSRITLMTPEPDAGYYGKQGAEAFVRKYGYQRTDGVLYFTGTHKVNTRQNKTKQLLTLEGFDPTKGKIINVDGGIYMTDVNDNDSAVWSYPGLIKHWGRKHANAVYVRYTSRSAPGPQYQYLSPVRLGVGTDFNKYLAAMYAGHVVYDPATKYTPNDNGNGGKVKARSQFRMASKNLTMLYTQFFEIGIDGLNS